MRLTPQFLRALQLELFTKPLFCGPIPSGIGAGMGKGGAPVRTWTSGGGAYILCHWLDAFLRVIKFTGIRAAEIRAG